ncbi:unnamed protein product [Linum trigynum]|uniref:Uncharacterized protein n=1 Tax=Linum trigynum TaxID=586398 RepID=A0AAV2EGT7_9ROSI
MASRRPQNYENAIRKKFGPNRCLMDLSSVENRINRLHYRWRVASARFRNLLPPESKENGISEKSPKIGEGTLLQSAKN